MAAAAAVAGGEERNGGKGGLWKSCAGAVFFICFWLQKFLGSFMLIIILKKKRIRLNRDVSDLHGGPIWQADLCSYFSEWILQNLIKFSE